MNYFILENNSDETLGVVTEKTLLKYNIVLKTTYQVYKYYSTKKQKIKGLFWESKKCLSGNANELQGCEDEENS